MNIKEYIESGILEQYCLGLLSDEQKVIVEKTCQMYPEIRQEKLNIELALERYAEANAIDPNDRVKEKIFDFIYNRPTRDLEKLPLISHLSDYKDWLNIIEGMIPEKIEGNRFYKILQQSDTISQILIVSSSDFDTETHDDLLESFLILDGECECTIGDNIFRLNAGGFAEIPLYQPHSVRILTPYVSAILQRVALQE